MLFVVAVYLDSILASQDMEPKLRVARAPEQ